MKASGLAQRRGSRARQAWLALVLAASASLEALPPQVRAQARSSPTGRSSAASTPAPAADALQLRVRRLPDAVELVLVDAGLGASLTQQPLGNQWLGELRTDRARSLKVGPQSLALAADGMERISFEGSGTSFRLTVTAVAGRNLPQPIVSSDGRDLVVRFPAAPNVVAQTARPNLRQPTPVPTAANLPPLRPRAVAPPVGDMAIGSMVLRNRGFLNLSGPPVTLTTRGANARDVLMVLAQMGGYGFAWVDDAEPDKTVTKTDVRSTGVSQTELPILGQKSAPVSVLFRSEPYASAFNAVLMSAGLQARKEPNSRTIFVGYNVLAKTFGSQVSKVYRLNQVSSGSAADYLANLGAKVTKTNTTLTSVTSGGDQNQPQGAPNSATTITGSETKIEAYGASSGPLIGLQATTDSRLSTITLVGDGDLISVAEQYLKQLDLRQRQVALSLKILDVNLDNVTDVENSFGFRFGNNFIISEKGEMLAAFGSSEGWAGIGTTKTTTTQTLKSGDDASQVITATIGQKNDLDQKTISKINSVLSQQIGGTSNFTSNSDGTFTLTFSPDGSSSSTASSLNDVKTTITSILNNDFNLSDVTTATSFDKDVTDTTIVTSTEVPVKARSADKFYDLLRAQIVSTSTKVIASPTLILQDNPGFLREAGGGSTSSSSSSSSSSSGATLQGIRPIGIDSPIGRRNANEGVVTVGTNVVTSYEVSSTQGALQCVPTLSTAGLVLGARVEKIDDNGFVTFALSPSISAVTGTEQPPPGCGSELNILSVRSLDTGALRVRDGQTLVLTGVISDFDRAVVTKWPVLGDLPLIGQFFRDSATRREKRELVILATPRIIDDEQGGLYGYGYRPSTTDARQLLYGTTSAGSPR